MSNNNKAACFEENKGLKKESTLIKQVCYQRRITPFEFEEVNRKSLK